MVAKIIAWGRDRGEALARLRVALARDHGRRQGRDDDQVVPARAARPPRGDRRHGRHRLARPGRADRTGLTSARTPTSRCCPSPSTSYEAEESRSASVPALRPRRPAPGQPRGRARRSSSATAGRVLQADGRADRPAPVPRDVLDGHASRSTWSGSRGSRAGSTSAGGGTAWCRVTTRPDHLVEVDSVATGCRGTRAASSARPRRRWSSSVARGGRRRRRGRRAGGGPREHEDGDPDQARPYAGRVAGGPGRRQLPGRRRGAAAAHRPGRRGRRGRDRGPGGLLAGGARGTRATRARRRSPTWPRSAAW